MVRVEQIKPRTHIRGSQSVGERMAMADLFCRPGFPAHLNLSCPMLRAVNTRAQ
jgi:hypothetical protein